MTHSDDWNDDMMLLDHDTADRLVRGAVAPDDAPPGYAEVAGLLGELRDEPVVVDDSRLAELTAAVQSSVTSRSRSSSLSRSRLTGRTGRSRRRVPAAIVGGVAIAMLVAPVAARIARDIDLSGPSEAPGTVVTPPSGAVEKGEPPRRPAAAPAKQRSRAASTPAADHAAVTVPVGSDAPLAPLTPTPAPTEAAPAESTPASEVTEPTCEHGEASAKDGRPCPGGKRPPAADDGPPRRGPER